MGLIVITGDEVREHLTYEACIPLMRQAMISLSDRKAQQPLRQIVALASGRGAFGLMPGALDHAEGGFGAKLLSVFPGAHALGLPSHQGLIALFDPETGAPVCLLPAAEVTAVRTAAASAAATDALAAPDASTLAVLGTGTQAEAHLLAMARIRRFNEGRIWGRNAAHAEALAERLRPALPFPVRAAASVSAAVHRADVICTVTSAAEPVLSLSDVATGAHVNAVGSSRAGPVEIAPDLVAASVYVADHRESAQEQGAELLRAIELGLATPEHIRAEIGEVFAGRAAGRTAAGDITLYKSLGSIVQDLASGWWLFQQARNGRFGQELRV